MKHSIWVSLLLISFCTLAIENNIATDDCPSSEACISKLYEIVDRSSTHGAYPRVAEQAVIKKLLELGEDAIPLIVQLLEVEDEFIARIGAVALAEAENIDPKYLPEIVKGLEKDISWLVPALANIDTPEAAEIVIKKYLASTSSPHNQEANALRRLGKKAFPAIIKAAKCQFNCNDQTHYLLGYALGEIENERAEAAQLLIELAEDRSLSTEIRRGVLYMISFLDTPGLVIEDNLLTIKNNEPQLTDAANQALIGVKSNHSGKIYADLLNQGADRYILRDIAAQGVSGNDAGAAIVALLNYDEMEIRLMAARTLGFIEYTQAAPALVQLLNEPSDVRLNWVAAESLGRMQSETAKSALQSSADNHWYSPVRDAARIALKHINSGKPYQSKYPGNNFAFEYFGYQHFDLTPCEKTTLKTSLEPEDQKLNRSSAKDKFERLAYQSVILGYGAGDEEQQRAENPDGIIQVNQGNMVEYRKETNQVPQVALRVDDGWLAGTSRGEWGGELVYIPDNEQAVIILDENVEDIYKLGDRHIATTGLAHMGSNQGMIYELFQDQKTHWHAKEWLALPGAPASSWLVETGEVLINTTGGGSILLSDNGSLRMATCK